ncbi:MAG TPA: signal peptidase I [Gemmatirosa sp.]
MAASSTKSANSRNAVADLRAGRRTSSRPRTGGRSTARRGAAGIWESARAFLGTIVLFLVIRTFLVEAFRIPSGSMIPTLLVGDWLFVNKLVYGPHLPFTSVTLPGYADPKRGDVVVFESPYQGDEAARGADPAPTLVKRLVGLPGDTLYMRDGLLYVDGVPQRQGYAASNNYKGFADETNDLFGWQRQYALAASRFGAAPTTPTHDNWGPLVIPPRHYMMLGDNRYCSKDSRYWGLVPRANLRGRPIFVYYSYRPAPDDDAGPSTCDPDRSDKPAPFLTDVRWGRIGHVIR